MYCISLIPFQTPHSTGFRITTALNIQLLWVMNVYRTYIGSDRSCFVVLVLIWDTFISCIRLSRDKIHLLLGIFISSKSIHQLWACPTASRFMHFLESDFPGKSPGCPVVIILTIIYVVIILTIIYEAPSRHAHMIHLHSSKILPV